MGADNTWPASSPASTSVTRSKAENDCEHGRRTLDTKGAGHHRSAVNGMIAGFEEACGKIDEAKFRSLDVGGTTDLA